MADKAIKKGKKSTSRYLPEAAWAAMSKSERKEKISEINKVEKEFREKQQSLQKELQTKQNSELTRIRVIVETAINEYAKDNDYDLILRADGTTLYAKTYVDITQDIIDKLN